MRPAFSVIFFSVASGAGYGLLACAAVAAVFAPLCPAAPCPPIAASDPSHPLFLCKVVLIALAFVVAGLCSSVLHLGRPLRAWRAFSEWRTSWLSREGVSAVISLALASVFVMALWRGSPELCPRLFAALALAAAIATVYCTARIYTSLPPIPAWRHGFVMPVHLVFAATTGLALWLTLLSALDIDQAAWRAWLLAVLAIATLVLKWRYWHDIDAIAMPSTARMTGLDRIGTTRSFEAPHTEANYLTKEMGFRFARRHSRLLRRAVLIALFVVALLAGVLALGSPSDAIAPTALLALLSAVMTLFAAFVERWLFFAEARHMVMSYYQR